ncbi:methyltransferase domain-containing protein [Patescibacteria group bacterium]
MTAEIQNFLQDISSDNQPRTVLDFGCGNGIFTNAISDLLPGNMTLFGYEPLEHLHKLIHKNNGKDNCPGFNVLPAKFNFRNKFNVVIFHFSIHHFDFKKILNTLKTISPKYLILIDFDYSTATKIEFVEDFCRHEAGMIELEKMGLKKCYDFHNKFHLPNYFGFTLKAGYCIDRIHPGEKFFLGSPYRFMLIAKKP